MEKKLGKKIKNLETLQYVLGGGDRSFREAFEKLSPRRDGLCDQPMDTTVYHRHRPPSVLVIAATATLCRRCPHRPPLTLPRYCMENMKEIRESETKHLVKIRRLKDTFALLVKYLPEGAMSKDELDADNILDNRYKLMCDKAEVCSQDVKNVQGAHKRTLIADVNDFVGDVDRFRKEWTNNGPMGEGVQAELAIERLGTLRDKLEIRERKLRLYQDGQTLFKLPVTEFPDIQLTRKEVGMCDGVFGVYTDVKNSIDGWKELQWSQVMCLCVCGGGRGGRGRGLTPRRGNKPPRRTPTPASPSSSTSSPPRAHFRTSPPPVARMSAYVSACVSACAHSLSRSVRSCPSWKT